MDKLKKMFEGKPVWKIALGLGVLLLGALVVLWLVGFAFRSAFGSLSVTKGVFNAIAPSYPYEADYAVSEGYGGGSVPQLSARNIGIPPMPGGSITVGNDAEEYEATDYSVSYETGKLMTLCADIESLKSRKYVVFESANNGDKNCYYSFKVEKSYVDEIRILLESLDPRTIVENTYTIKTQVEDFTSREDILKKKLTAIEETLAQASRAYDELRVLATSARDAESLAKVIESKINLIERLTNERLSLREQLDRLAQQKSLQLDRLDYTYFRIDVSEKLIVDTESIKDFWIAELQKFVRELNQVIQGITFGLLGFVLQVLQLLFYAFVILVVLKYGWRFVKGFWTS